MPNVGGDLKVNRLTLQGMGDSTTDFKMKVDNDVYTIARGPDVLLQVARDEGALAINNSNGSYAQDLVTIGTNLQVNGKVSSTAVKIGDYEMSVSNEGDLVIQ